MPCARCEAAVHTIVTFFIWHPLLIFSFTIVPIVFYLAQCYVVILHSPSLGELEGAGISGSPVTNSLAWAL